MAIKGLDPRSSVDTLDIVAEISDALSKNRIPYRVVAGNELEVKDDDGTWWTVIVSSCSDQRG